MLQLLPRLVVAPVARAVQRVPVSVVLGCAVPRAMSTTTPPPSPSPSQSVAQSEQPAAAPSGTPSGASASTYTTDTSDGDDDDDFTHFGFSQVPRGQKQQQVNDVFQRVAQNYDVMNDSMSFGMHRLWKDAFVDSATPLVSQRGPTRLLDVAGGTGDIAFRLADALRVSLAPATVTPEIVVSDINPDMLQVGKDRAAELGYGSGTPAMSWVEADAQKLPFPDDTFDLYTIAFGIRNVPDIQRALVEAHRVLKPGGRFMCLEFSHVDTPGIRELYDAYSMNVIPAMGAAVAKDRAAYQYLVESIRQFPTQEAFLHQIQRGGFTATHYTNLTFGVVAIHSGIKPLAS